MTSSAPPSNAEGALPARLGSHDPVERIGRILDRPPDIRGEPLRGQTRLTSRWAHGAVHDALPGLASHVVMTYYGSVQDIVWQSDGRRLVSRTRAGTITLIPEGHGGRWDVAGPIEVSHVYLPDARLQACADQLADGKRIELVGRVAFDDPSAAHIMELLSREAGREDASSRLFAEQAVDLLCIQLVRGHSSLAALPMEQCRGGLPERQVKRITDYMREHIDEEISLDGLASLVSLGRFHFCTAFRKATGYSPYQWLVLLRINEARRLLAVSELPVIQVALSVGYQTPSAFAAAFRKATGKTPSEFRRDLA